MPNIIKLITFDAFGTLYRPQGGNIGHLYVKEALRHHMKTNEADINKSFKNAFATMRQRYPNYGYSHKMTSQYWWNQVVRLTYLGAGVDEKVLSSKIGVLADSLYKKFSTSDAYRLYPDTKPVLKELHSRNIKLGVISNSDERVAKVLSSLGIGKFWDFVLVSSEVGYEKPSPMIFQKALEFDDEIKEQEILHVGDDEIGDYEGAKQIGFNSLLLRRNLLKNDADNRRKNMLIIRDLSEIFNFDLF